MGQATKELDDWKGGARTPSCGSAITAKYIPVSAISH